jgi:hypothetical protein
MPADVPPEGSLPLPTPRGECGTHQQFLQYWVVRTVRADAMTTRDEDGSILAGVSDVLGSHAVFHCLDSLICGFAGHNFAFLSHDSIVCRSCAMHLLLAHCSKLFQSKPARQLLWSLTVGLESLGGLSQKVSRQRGFVERDLATVRRPQDHIIASLLQVERSHTISEDES